MPPGELASQGSLEGLRTTRPPHPYHLRECRRRGRGAPSDGDDAVPDGLDQLRGDVRDAVLGGRVGGGLAEDAVLVGGRESGTAAGDDVSAGEGLHGWWTP